MCETTTIVTGGRAGTLTRWREATTKLRVQHGVIVSLPALLYRARRALGFTDEADVKAGGKVEAKAKGPETKAEGGATTVPGIAVLKALQASRPYLNPWQKPFTFNPQL